jgi:hypothetical protein
MERSITSRVLAIVFKKMPFNGHRPGGDFDIPCPTAVTPVTTNMGHFPALTQGFDRFYATC